MDVEKRLAGHPVISSIDRPGLPLQRPRANASAFLKAIDLQRVVSGWRAPRIRGQRPRLLDVRNVGFGALNSARPTSALSRLLPVVEPTTTAAMQREPTAAGAGWTIAVAAKQPSGSLLVCRGRIAAFNPPAGSRSTRPRASNWCADCRPGTLQKTRCSTPRCPCSTPSMQI